MESAVLESLERREDLVQGARVQTQPELFCLERKGRPAGELRDDESRPVSDQVGGDVLVGVAPARDGARVEPCFVGERRCPYVRLLRVGGDVHELGHVVRDGRQPLFPFGFGLSYTTFSFSKLSIKPSDYDGTQPVTVSFTITNTGSVPGAEVAQLYVGEQKAPLPRPIRELKGFQKVFLQPGQSQKVTLQLNQRSFAYWNTNIEKWDAPKDTYNVWVGSSSQLSDLSLEKNVSVLQEITANP